MTALSHQERREQFKREALRKGIHLLIALIPTLAGIGRLPTIALLCAGSLFYLCCEIARQKGRAVPLLSHITAFASRPRESGRLVLGPVTLAAGAILSLILFPALEAGSLQTCRVAIYALAFGDGLSGLIGRSFGRVRPALLRGKSVEGSAVCFLAVLISTYAVTRRLRVSLATAFVSMIAEALPLRNADNIIIPLAAGLTAFITTAALH
jgi:dolichol kinase